jgi:hypothetical protein
MHVPRMPAHGEVAVRELRHGIDIWLRRGWPSDFHNNVYVELADADPRGNFSSFQAGSEVVTPLMRGEPDRFAVLVSDVAAGQPAVERILELRRTALEGGGRSARRRRSCWR